MNFLFKFTFAAILFSLLFTGCTEEKAKDTRGTLNSYSLLASYTPSQVDSIKAGYGSTLLTVIPSIYGIELYKVSYETIDPFGKPITATGLLVMPVGVDGPSPLAQYHHGTMLRKRDAPSYGGGESIIGILLASFEGFTISMPDYLGLGDGEGMHYYSHAKSEATASVDMIRATRNFVAENPQFKLRNKVYLMGYSQGGQAAMATTKEIEAYHADEIELAASYPMAGAYDIDGAQSDFIVSDKPYSNPYYVPYILLSYNEIYKMYPTTEDYMKQPYASILPPLFDGLHGGGSVDAVLPEFAFNIVKDDIIEDFKTNPDNTFRKALRENNLTIGWTPKTPMRMCHCQSDEQVSYFNSYYAQYAFRTRGVEVPLLNPGVMAHPDCALPCLLDCLGWFQQLKPENN